MKYLFFIILLLIIILACSMLSYKIETFNNVGTVIDRQNPSSLDVYNCYDYIKQKFPSWDIDNYSAGELKVLGTLRTGLDQTYQTDGTEPQYTDACILPNEHSFIYSTDSGGNRINIPGMKGQTHILPLNNKNGAENPNGFKIDFYQPNQNTGIDYSKQDNFRDLLQGGYKIMDSEFAHTLMTLSNQLWLNYNYPTAENQNMGYSNIYVKYVTIDIPENKKLLNSAISKYKSICLLDNSPYNTLCTVNQLPLLTEPCCSSSSDCIIAQKQIIAIDNVLSINQTSLDAMKQTIQNIEGANIDELINKIQQYLNIIHQSSSQSARTARTLREKPPPPTLTPPPPPPPVLPPPPPPNPNASCYGARDTSDCYTCDDVVNAYVNRGWAYNRTNFIQCPPQQVTVFVDCDFSGQSASHGVGDYNMNDMGVPNDSISSIRIPPGMTFIGYWDSDFGGDSFTATSDISCLDNWNDQISSFRIR
jgi:hypothetical protein